MSYIRAQMRQFISQAVSSILFVDNWNLFNYSTAYSWATAWMRRDDDDVVAGCYCYWDTLCSFRNCCLQCQWERFEYMQFNTVWNAHSYMMKSSSTTMWTRRDGIGIGYYFAISILVYSHSHFKNRRFRMNVFTCNSCRISSIWCTDIFTIYPFIHSFYHLFVCLILYAIPLSLSFASIQRIEIECIYPMRKLLCSIFWRTCDLAVCFICRCVSLS